MYVKKSLFRSKSIFSFCKFMTERAKGNSIFDTQAHHNINSNRNPRRFKQLNLSIDRQIRLLMSARCNFSTNWEKKGPQNSGSKKPTEEQLSALIFCPQLLMFHINKVIDQQIKIIQNLNSKTINNKQSEYEKKNDNINVNISNRGEISFSSLQKIVYMLRIFINFALKLDSQIEIMNEVQYDEDYKLDTLYKIRDNQFVLIELLQKELQNIKNSINIPKNTKQFYPSQSQSQKNPESHLAQTKQLTLIMCQIILLAKILQVASNTKSFDPIKCFLNYKTWKQRLKYFKQGLPLGVQSSCFKKCKKTLFTIEKNIQNLHHGQKGIFQKIINNFLTLDFLNELENGRTSRNKFYPQNKNSIQDSSTVNKEGKMGENEVFVTRLQQYYNKYNQSNTIYHQLRTLFTEPKQPAALSGLARQYRQYFQQYNRDKAHSYVIEKPDRKLQVDYRFVQYGVMLYFSREYSNQQKIDMLNDIRNNIQNDYIKFQDHVATLKELGSTVFGSDRRWQNKQYHGLVAYNFMEYMRANHVYTWIIYRIEKI